MAGNAFSATTKCWFVDTAGELNAGGVQVQFIYFTPAAIDEDLVLTDADDNAWFSMKCRHDQIQSQYVHFNPAIRLPSLKVGTIDGNAVAYIQFRTDR